MTDSELHEAIRGLYRIHRAGQLDELRRWIYAAEQEYPVAGSVREDPRWLAVSLFAHDVAPILGIDKERVEKAACDIYIPTRPKIVLEEIRRMLRWLDRGGEEGERIDAMMEALAAETDYKRLADFQAEQEATVSLEQSPTRPPLKIEWRKPA